MFRLIFGLRAIGIPDQQGALDCALQLANVSLPVIDSENTLCLDGASEIDEDLAEFLQEV